MDYKSNRFIHIYGLFQQLSWRRGIVMIAVITMVCTNVIARVAGRGFHTIQCSQWDKSFHIGSLSKKSRSSSLVSYFVNLSASVKEWRKESCNTGDRLGKYMGSIKLYENVFSWMLPCFFLQLLEFEWLSAWGYVRNAQKLLNKPRTE